MSQLNPRNSSGQSKCSTKHILQIQSTVPCPAQYEPHVVTHERCPGSQFPQHPTKVVNAHSQHFREPRLAPRSLTISRELRLEVAHPVRRPQVPGIGYKTQPTSAVF